MHYSSKFEKQTDDPNITDDEDNLSDIDDEEVNLYLHSKEESHFKKRIWEELNREYVEEQAAKKAAAAVASKAFGDDSEDVRKARELAAATAAALAKTKELIQKKRQKRAMDAKNDVPPQTSAEAPHQMLEKQEYSSKINYAELEKLLAESDDIPDVNDDTCKEKQKDDQNEDIEQEENEDDIEDEDEYNVGDEWYDGEEKTCSYDDYYDPDNTNEDEW